MMQVQENYDDAAFDYFGGVVDVKIDAPPSLNSEIFMRLQTEDNFENLAQKKKGIQMIEPLSKIVLVKFGFLKDGSGFHLGTEKFQIKEDKK